MMVKTCTKCGEVKPLSDYHKMRAQGDGHRSKCKACRKGDTRKYYEDNRELVLYRCRIYYEDNREDVIKRVEKYQLDNAETLNFKSEKRVNSLREMSKSIAVIDKGTPWTQAEDVFLMEENGLTIYQKSIELGRTFESCRWRRWKLRKELGNA